jgi:hypothetical protein
MIIAITSPAVLALKQADVKTPVVFAFVTDPVGLGIVASLAHPGGNFTGVTYSEATLGGEAAGFARRFQVTQRLAVMWSRSLTPIHGRSDHLTGTRRRLVEIDALVALGGSRIAGSAIASAPMIQNISGLPQGRGSPLTGTLS